MPDRLVPPFHVEELASSFKVVDSEGTVVAFTYRRDPGAVGTSQLPSKDVARKMAMQIARLPELLSKS